MYHTVITNGVNVIYSTRKYNTHHFSQKVAREYAIANSMMLFGVGKIDWDSIKKDVSFTLYS